jgi:hypothetical protein
MGIAASIPPKNAEISHHSRNSTGSGGGGGNSVRAMALKNHARQENSYIPSDRLRSKVPHRLQETSDFKATPKQIVNNSKSKIELPCDEPKETVVVPPASGLDRFKMSMNLNLKISLEDSDNNWGKVIQSVYGDDDKTIQNCVLTKIVILSYSIAFRFLMMKMMWA